MSVSTQTRRPGYRMAWTAGGLASFLAVAITAMYLSRLAGTPAAGVALIAAVIGFSTLIHRVRGLYRRPAELPRPATVRLPELARHA